MLIEFLWVGDKSSSGISSSKRSISISSISDVSFFSKSSSSCSVALSNSVFSEISELLSLDGVGELDAHPDNVMENATVTANNFIAIFFLHMTSSTKYFSHSYSSVIIYKLLIIMSIILYPSNK